MIGILKSVNLTNNHTCDESCDYKKAIEHFFSSLYSSIKTTDSEIERVAYEKVGVMLEIALIKHGVLPRDDNPSNH